jgi:hypothetical protein
MEAGLWCGLRRSFLTLMEREQEQSFLFSNSASAATGHGISEGVYVF